MTMAFEYFICLFQLSIADDACQPPAALQGKLKEVDKLIQTESSESGRVSWPCSSLNFNI